MTPADIAGAESAESPDSDESKAKQRRFAGLFAALAAVMLFAGDEFYAMFLAAFALYSALMGESRRRVPKLLRFLAAAVVVVLGVVKIVLWILETGGR